MTNTLVLFKLKGSVLQKVISGFPLPIGTTDLQFV